MEFWGVEVKSGETVKVDPEEFDAYIHLSQAALGESKKDNGSETVVLHLKVDDQKLVLGTLSREKFPQLSFDLVLDKEFELSHNWKNGSVYFCGYKAEVPDDDGDFDDESDDEEDLQVIPKDNGKPDTKTEEVQVGVFKKSVAKGPLVNQVKVVGSKKDEKEDSEDDDDDSDEEDDEAGSSEEDMMDADSDDSESDEDDEETPPKKADQGKKRPNDSASKTPIPSKKAKSATPQKTDSKKGGHTDTPHPKKKDIKTPNSDSKSGGQFSCKSCSKSFTSEGGLQQHSKAKHG